MQRKIYFVLMLLWMGVIFGFSAQPAAESTQTSLRVGRLVCGIFVKDYEEMSAAEQTALAENIEFRSERQHMRQSMRCLVYWSLV